MGAWSSLEWLLRDMDEVREALAYRAHRNFRTALQEFRAIVAESLREEVEAIRRERASTRESERGTRDDAKQRTV